MISHGPRLRVLAVDDEPNILTLMEVTLRGEGHLLKTALGAEEALRFIGQEQFDVIISDHAMPEMTGIEVLRLASRAQPDTLRLLLTAHVTLAEAVDAMNQGIIHQLIRKPWGSGALTHTLREAAWERAERHGHDTQERGDA